MKHPSVVAIASSPRSPVEESSQGSGGAGMIPAAHSEARDETIFRYTRQMMRDRRVSWEVFGQQIAEIYASKVPADVREVTFSEDKDVAHRMRSNGQLVKRWFDRNTTTRFPVQAEEAWVEALIEPYRTDCKHELARRYGFLAAPIPHGELSVAEGLRCMSTLSSEFGNAVQAIAQIVSDGKIDEDDKVYAARAMRELEQLIATAISLKEQLNQI